LIFRLLADYMCLSGDCIKSVRCFAGLIKVFGQTVYICLQKAGNSGDDICRIFAAPKEGA